MKSSKSSDLRIYPCLCGFTCEKYSVMKTHRETCLPWQSRPDPLKLMIERRRMTQGVEAPTPFAQCPMCHRRADHHFAECPDSHADVVRRQLLKKHDIDPFKFEILLRALAKRYDERR